MAGSPDPFQLPLQCGGCRLPDHLRPFGVDARLIPVEKHPVSQYPRPSGDAEGLSNNAAIRANEAIRPAASLKVGGARRIIGKQPLEFGESLGKRQVSSMLDIRQLRRKHNHPGSPFPTRCWDVQRLSGNYYI